MQLCVAHGEKEEVDQAWGALVRRTTALEGMRSNLIMESSRWAKANQRLKAINTLSLTPYHPGLRNLSDSELTPGNGHGRLSRAVRRAG
ncbi:hypothetical protein LN650_04360 [Klebsiella pneumoniae subsp. pneumoniae]|nr:hypothetical protein [Klebsiella pneumoniae subsp. pneumoniae]